MKIVILGLSITSSWGNGHATTYRALVRALTNRGHDVHFLEADRPWYASHRDMAHPPFCRTTLYRDLNDLKPFAAEIESADCVIVGSYVPDGVRVGEWVTSVAGGMTAFYDIDTPVTLAKMERGDYEYLSPDVIPRYDIYLSFTGGPTLEFLNTKYGAANPRPFYCSVDPDHYYPETVSRKWDLGYLGTYSPDRQPSVVEFLIEPAERLPMHRFAVAGPQYPAEVIWPKNIEYITHLNPSEHRAFYNAQRYTLNVTRQDMARSGWSPSVRLFEAAACGTPVVSDSWNGMDEFFMPGREILIVDSNQDVQAILRDMPETERSQIAQRARERVLNGHTSAHRARELEALILESQKSRSQSPSQMNPRLLEPQQVAS